MTRFKWLSNQMGFSMVELMAAILIAGSILGVMGTFLVAHIKSYEVTQDVVSMQYDLQLAINQMSEIAMESQGIYAIQTYDGTNYIDVETDSTRDKIQPARIVFISKDRTEATYYDVFTLVATEKTLYYNRISNISDISLLGYEFANNIQALTITPVKNKITGSTSQVGSETFDETEGLEVKFEIGKSIDQTIKASTIVKFRNK